MTSRELVTRSLEVRRPARIPRLMGLLPWATSRYPTQVKRIQKRFPDDLLGCPYFCKPVQGIGDPYGLGTYVDEWGCSFVNRQAGVIGEVKEPLVKTWKDLALVKEPRNALTVDIDRVTDFCDQTDLFVMAPCCPRPFERLQFLRGTEYVMLDLALKSPELQVLLQ